MVHCLFSVLVFEIMLLPETLPTSQRARLLRQYAHKLVRTDRFSRKTVSFQANKEEPVYRWFRYKEGFASVLVKHLLSVYHPLPGHVLDPFAGAGTTLFAGSELGWQATGVELLPVGLFVMDVRQAIDRINVAELRRVVQSFWESMTTAERTQPFFQHIPITKDAFPAQTDDLLNKYIAYCETIADDDLRKVLLFAAFTILEEISFTRKDGQYLRWDSRSARDLKGKFDKGRIYTFEEAIRKKLNQILADLEPDGFSPLFQPEPVLAGPITVLSGSCLDVLPGLAAQTFDFVVTSPPYCNRYDYTRTYALELVFLGCTNDQVRDLRQTMLSCTVENKEKLEYLRTNYAARGEQAAFAGALNVYQTTEAMNEVSFVLDELNRTGKLNNANIARMVKNYFLEMCFVIYELSRTLRPGGYVAMVNDNVQYGGEEIPVDLILSEFAASFGLETETIFVLPQGKGNSSQQMGNYGRTEIRKCVYLWRKKN